MSLLFGTNSASALIADASLSQLSYPFTVVGHIKVTNANASISSVFGLAHDTGNVRPVKFSLSPLSGILSVGNNYGSNPYTHSAAYADTTSIYGAAWQLVYMQFDSSTEAQHYFNGVQESVTTFDRAIDPELAFPFLGYGSRNRVKIAHFAIFNEALSSFAKSELANKTPDNISGHVPVFYKTLTDDAVTGIGPAMTDVLDDAVIDDADNPSLTAAPAVNPVFAAAPSTANIGETALEVSATSDTNCTAQIVITAQGAAQPSDASFNNNSVSTTALANQSFTVLTEGLTGLTSYTAWVRLKPVTGTSAYASVNFQTTPAAPSIAAIDTVDVRVNSTVRISGSGFTGHTAVSIDGYIQPDFTVLDDSTIEFTLSKTGVRHGDTASLNIGGTSFPIVTGPALGRSVVDIDTVAVKANRFDVNQSWDIDVPDQVEYDDKSGQLQIKSDGTIELAGGFSLPDSLTVVVFDSSDSTWGDEGVISLVVDSSDPDLSPPLISLLGENPMNIALGGSYVEPGAVWSDDIDGTGAVTIIGGSVDVNTAGSYLITYDFSDAAGNAAAQVTRTVNVAEVDTTKPVISLLGDNPLSLNQGSAYVEAGASWSDNVDGSGSVTNIAGSVDINTPGSYTVTYDFSDAAGNAADQVSRTVNVIAVDSIAPVITLNGSSSINLSLGQSYSEQGASWSDNVDGSGNVVDIVGTVDVNTAGSYTVAYNFTDSAGNAAIEVTRTVQVLADFIEAKEVLKVSRANDIVFYHDGLDIPETSPKHPRSRIYKGFALLALEEDETLTGHAILINDQFVDIGESVDGLVFHGSQTNGVDQIKAELSGGIEGKEYVLTLNYSTQYVPSDFKSQIFIVKAL